MRLKRREDGRMHEMVENWKWNYYLIIVNIVGFVVYLINKWLYDNTAEGQIDALLTIVSLAGGSLGIVVAILLFDRKPEKGNMMSRVFVAVVLVIQIIIFLIAKGFIAKELHFAFWQFFSDHKWLVYYLVIINVITLVAFGIDKINAIEHRSRIRIITLLGLAFIGGSIGALIAMYAFRHKTRVDYFTVGVPLILIMQIIVLFYMMNLPEI